MSSAAATDHETDHETGPELTYFVCTLGQAASINQKNPHSFHTVDEFLDAQAQAVPGNPAVGFPIVSGQQKHEVEWIHQVFSASLELGCGPLV